MRWSTRFVALPASAFSFQDDRRIKAVATTSMYDFAGGLHQARCEALFRVVDALGGLGHDRAVAEREAAAEQDQGREHGRQVGG